MRARHYFLLGLVSLWAGYAAAATDPARQPLQAYAAGVIVKTQAKQSLQRLLPSMQTLADGQGIRLRPMRVMGDGAQVLDADRFLSLTQAENLAADIAALPGVEYAEPNTLMQPLLAPNDLHYPLQWHYFEDVGGVRLPNAWDISTGANVVVAVLDTGYRPHVDLAANVLPGYDMVSSLFIGNDDDGRDSDARDPGDWATADLCYKGQKSYNSGWHGTHVAGTIAAIGNNMLGVVGVAFNARILPVRVLGRCGGFLSDAADGIRWAAGLSVQGVPANPTPARVINMSMGGPGACSHTYLNAIDAARAANVTIVVSAGNANQDAGAWQPASCNGVITVAATTRVGGKVSYSNFGAAVDLAAPGNGILSTANSGATVPEQDNYLYYGGTSMAAPHVAGVAALLYAMNPDLTPDEVESVLEDTARDFPQTCQACGSGIVDAAAAVAALNLPDPRFFEAWMAPVLELMMDDAHGFAAWMIPVQQLGID